MLTTNELPFIPHIIHVISRDVNFYSPNTLFKQISRDPTNEHVGYKLIFLDNK